LIPRCGVRRRARGVGRRSAPVVRGACGRGGGRGRGGLRASRSCRIQDAAGPGPRLGLGRRAQDRRAEALAGGLFEVAAGVALVADHQLAAVQPDLEHAKRDVALLLWRGEDRRSGVPSGAANRCRRMPQNLRLWPRLQWCAKAGANCERRAVSNRAAALDRRGVTTPRHRHSPASPGRTSPSATRSCRP
jgi:hypothetical protein